jgi:hypothetical protein
LVAEQDGIDHLLRRKLGRNAVEHGEAVAHLQVVRHELLLVEPAAAVSPELNVADPHRVDLVVLPAIGRQQVVARDIMEVVKEGEVERHRPPEAPVLGTMHIRDDFADHDEGHMPDQPQPKIVVAKPPHREMTIIHAEMRLLGQRPRYQEGPPEGAGSVG